MEVIACPCPSLACPLPVCHIQLFNTVTLPRSVFVIDRENYFYPRVFPTLKFYSDSETPDQKDGTDCGDRLRDFGPSDRYVRFRRKRVRSSRLPRNRFRLSRAIASECNRKTYLNSGVRYEPSVFCALSFQARSDFARESATGLPLLRPDFRFRHCAL